MRSRPNVLARLCRRAATLDAIRREHVGSQASPCVREPCGPHLWGHCASMSYCRRIRDVCTPHERLVPRGCFRNRPAHEDCASFRAIEDSLARNPGRPLHPSRGCTPHEARGEPRHDCSGHPWSPSMPRGLSSNPRGDSTAEDPPHATNTAKRKRLRVDRGAFHRVSSIDATRSLPLLGRAGLFALVKKEESRRLWVFGSCARLTRADHDTEAQPT